LTTSRLAWRLIRYSPGLRIETEIAFARRLSCPKSAKQVPIIDMTDRLETRRAFSDTELRGASSAELKETLEECYKIARGMEAATVLWQKPVHQRAGSTEQISSLKDTSELLGNEARRVQMEIQRRARFHTKLLVLPVLALFPLAIGLASLSAGEMGPVSAGLLSTGAVALFIGIMLHYVELLRRTDALSRDMTAAFRLWFGAGGVCLFLSWAIETPLVTMWEKLWPLALVGLATAVLTAAVEAVRTRLDRGTMKRFMANAVVTIAVFVLAVFASRFRLKEDEAIVAGAALTVVIVFLYVKISKRLGL
jgi:hypothetical protein